MSRLFNLECALRADEKQNPQLRRSVPRIQKQKEGFFLIGKNLDNVDPIVNTVDSKVNIEVGKMGQKRGERIYSDAEKIVLQGFEAHIVPKRQNGFGGRWFAMAQDALDVLTQFTRVEDFRVLMALLKRLDYENLITANQADIARELCIDRAQVNRAIKRLQGAGAVLEGPKVGISRTYRLNPSFGWKGSAKNHVAALDDERSKRMKAAGITGIVGGGRQATPELERDTYTLDMFDNISA